MKRRTTKALHPRKKQRVEGKSSKRSPCFILFCLPDYILGDIGKYLFSFFVKMKKQKKITASVVQLCQKNQLLQLGKKSAKIKYYHLMKGFILTLVTNIHNYFRCSAIKGKKWDQQHLCTLSFLFLFCFDRFFILSQQLKNTFYNLIWWHCCCGEEVMLIISCSSRFSEL